MVAIFQQGMKAPYFLSLREIFVFQGLPLFFQHRNIRQSRCTLIRRITHIHKSHASIFVIPAKSFSALKNTDICLHQKKVKEKLTVDSQRKVWG